MNVFNQKCNGKDCKAVNVNNAPGWHRSFGHYEGAPVAQSLPMTNYPNGTPVKGVTYTDLCPDCVGKYTLKDLAELITPPVATVAKK